MKTTLGDAVAVALHSQDGPIATSTSSRSAGGVLVDIGATSRGRNRHMGRLQEEGPRAMSDAIAVPWKSLATGSASRSSGSSNIRRPSSS